MRVEFLSHLHFILIFILSCLPNRLMVNSQPLSITMGKTLMKTTSNVCVVAQQKQSLN